MTLRLVTLVLHLSSCSFHIIEAGGGELGQNTVEWLATSRWLLLVVMTVAPCPVLGASSPEQGNGASTHERYLGTQQEIEDSLRRWHRKLWDP